MAEEAERRTASGAYSKAQAQALIDKCTVVQIDGPFGRYGGYDFCMCFITLKNNMWGQIALDLLNGVRSYGHNWSAVWGQNKPRHNSRGYNDPQKVYTSYSRRFCKVCKNSQKPPNCAKKKTDARKQPHWRKRTPPLQRATIKRKLSI